MVSVIIILAAALACLLLLYACCKIAAWSDRREYTDCAQPGDTAPDAPPCPFCATPRPFGPGSIEFEDGGSEMYYQCRKCGRLYWAKDTAPGRCWGAGA